MTASQRFLILTTVATMGFAPIVAQAAAPTQEIPDFSGIWSHPWLPGYEPLSSGPTSLINLSRRNGVSNPVQLVGDFNNPILKPDAVEIVKKHGEMSKANYGFHNPRNQCWPNGLPFVLSSNAQSILQREDHIVIAYSTDHQVRYIPLNTPRRADAKPSYFGNSVAHYEGDTLVIDTIGIKKGPFAMIDWFGTPQTENLHVVERYRVVSYYEAKDGIDRANKENALPDPPAVDLSYRGKHLQLVFTVEDPTVFTTPWSATVTFGKPASDWEWPEAVCAENPNKYGTEEDAQVPTASKADF
jgi:hypothetical protein